MEIGKATAPPQPLGGSSPHSLLHCCLEKGKELGEWHSEVLEAFTALHLERFPLSLLRTMSYPCTHGTHTPYTTLLLSYPILKPSAQPFQQIPFLSNASLHHTPFTWAFQESLPFTPPNHPECSSTSS